MAIVGAGRVGETLGMLLHRRGHRIAAVVSRSASSARRVARRLKAGIASNDIEDIPSTVDLLLIAAPDDSIPGIAGDVARQAPLQFRRVLVVHTSGLLTTDSLHAVRKRGAATASVHPMVAFPRGKTLTSQLRAMKGAAYGLEGTGRGATLGRDLIRALGGHAIRIPKQKKIAYHAACVFASNYLIVLIDILDRLGKHVHRSFDRRVFRSLVEQSLHDAMSAGPVEMLTGPIVRGSVGTIRAHSRSLRKWNQEAAELYAALGRHALTMVLSRGKVSGKKASMIRKLLKTTHGR